MFGTHEARRAGVYRQLASLETAGIPLGTATHKVLDREVERAAKALDDGEDPGAAWQVAGFSPLEIALVRAGAKGGTLAGAFSELEKIFEERSQQARRMVAALAYPVILMHLAVLLPRADVLVLKGVLPYARVTFVPLAIAWAVFLGALAVGRAVRKAVPAVTDPLLAGIPVFGGVITRRATAHGLHVLGALYRSGVPVRDALDAAADAATLYPVRAAFDRIGKRLDEGRTIGDAFLAEESLPREVREAASTGSLTGQLDVTLAGAERQLNSEAQMRQALILTATPVLLFLCVAGMIAWIVIGRWTEHFQQINDLMK